MTAGQIQAALPHIWARIVSDPLLGADSLGSGTQRAQMAR